jgi:transposase
MGRTNSRWNTRLAAGSPARELAGAAIALNQYLDRWLDLAARPKLRAKSFADYASLFGRYTSLIGMEACPGAHFLARVLRARRHEVKLMPAKYVRPFVKSNKNDYVDAEAIAEAVQRPTMRFVSIKSEARLDLQALHRVRDRWMGQRTAVINQIRGFLLEHGITLAVGPAHLKRQIPQQKEAKNYVRREPHKMK